MNALKNLWAKITGAYSKLPNAVRAAWNTAWITFTATFLTILIGLLPALVDAITNRNITTFTDSLSVAATAGTAAVTAFLVGIINGLYRWAKPIEGSYSGLNDA